MFKELFEPLEVNYCNYFYFSSVFGFILMCIMGLGLLSTFFSKKTKNNGVAFVSLIMQGFFIYFVNRLMYSMCIKSLM
jgi:hypothetical protein